MSYKLGADVGGTFTDVLLIDVVNNFKNSISGRICGGEWIIRGNLIPDWFVFVFIDQVSNRGTNTTTICKSPININGSISFNIPIASISI